MDRQKAAFQIYCALVSNSARYTYISEKVESGELTQSQATEKNINKSFIMADQFINSPQVKGQMMKQVIYSEYKRREGEKHISLIEIGEATFHQFGVDYEEFDCGPANFTTAVIELDDGTIKNVPVQTIRFVK